MSSRDILPCKTSASLAESKTSPLPPLASSAERTSMLPSDAAPKWADSSHPCCPGTMLVIHHGTHHHCQIQNPSLNKLDELKELHLDLRPDPEPPCQKKEEELDCEQHGEGDLVHLHLDGERATGEIVGDVGGMPSLGEFISISLSPFGYCGNGG